MAGTLALGAVIGLFQGWLTAYQRIPAFIVTLAGLMIFRGVIKGATGGETVGPLPAEFKFIGQAYVGKEIGWALAFLAVIATAAILWRRQQAGQRFGFATAPAWMTMLQILAGAALILTFAGYLNSYEGMPMPVLVLLGVAVLSFSGEQNAVRTARVCDWRQCGSGASFRHQFAAQYSGGVYFDG
ncbi:MAG: hypothetical protein ONB46_10105 [candidate division KSB1 bacterium]|nr:hypothetical protein [candidate division KSB1 bacterium]MDZ7366157.1 hypothetical protein [candidate division KSB1 bacterium]MDZ7404201.1 hypothetical protein [candidate division KSB1 bacterium]